MMSRVIIKNFRPGLTAGLAVIDFVSRVRIPGRPQAHNLVRPFNSASRHQRHRYEVTTFVFELPELRLVPERDRVRVACLHFILKGPPLTWRPLFFDNFPFTETGIRPVSVEI